MQAGEKGEAMDKQKSKIVEKIHEEVKRSFAEKKGEVSRPEKLIYIRF
jgi:hypothetical protein